MNTSLKKILFDEEIGQKELSTKIEDIELDKGKPGINDSNMSKIVNGLKNNITTSTMYRIVNGINAILKDRGIKKQYSLADIFPQTDED
jgi:hypothetical protein